MVKKEKNVVTFPIDKGGPNSDKGTTSGEKGKPPIIEGFNYKLEYNDMIEAFRAVLDNDSQLQTHTVVVAQQGGNVQMPIQKFTRLFEIAIVNKALAIQTKMPYANGAADMAVDMLAVLFSTILGSKLIGGYSHVREVLNKLVRLNGTGVKGVDKIDWGPEKSENEKPVTNKP